MSLQYKRPNRALFRQVTAAFPLKPKELGAWMGSSLKTCQVDIDLPKDMLCSHIVDDKKTYTICI